MAEDNKRPTFSNPYYYDQQYKRYILQFMAIFASMKVSVGKRDTGQTTPILDCDGNVTGQEPIIEEERLISVPIHWAAQDRVVASIFADNTQNKPLRLPVMSAYPRSIKMANDIRHGTGNVRRNTYVPTGGLVPDDVRVVYQNQANFFWLEMELNVYVSNFDHHFQIMEQIQLMFDPQLNIQTNDDVWDMSRLTYVELTDIDQDINFPPGTDQRIIQTQYRFKMPVYIMTPADVRRNFVEKVFLRIGIVNQAFVGDNYDIIAELDRLGIHYDLIASDEDLGFK